MGSSTTGQVASRHGKVKWMIAVAGVVIVTLFAAANFMVLDYAVRQADSYVGETEKRLVRNEFDRQIEQVVLYQSAMSVWDRSFEELADGRLSDDFVTRELRDWLWADFGFSWMVFAAASGEVAGAVHDGEAVSQEKAGYLLKWVVDLTQKAESAYFAALEPAAGGWRLKRPESDRDMLTPALPEIFTTGLRLINGKMSIVVVQAVVPKDLFIPEGRKAPTLMVTVKPISARLLADAERRLGLMQLGFAPIVTEDPNLMLTPIGRDAFNPLVASWRPNIPGAYVWTMALPQIALFVAAFVAVMLFVTTRFSSLVKALQKSEARNAFLARHDPLTGLLNRSGFDEVITAAARRAGLAPFAVFAMDLDRFKAVNDHHGHAAGDVVLKEVARRFSERVGRRGSVARLGGDEFAVLVERELDERSLLDLANGLVRDAQIPIAHDGQLLRVGSSAGIACFPLHGETVHDLMVVADVALYAAKNGGRNRAVYAGDAERAAAESAKAA
ncbi:diguanylate cyclase [Rhizobium sp. TRM95111]|uniref:diguanylate cyclase domain-containing protein n=1 Tax=Rhizobium alarense TaxID=2846851 RepID=UPI001F3DC569|nr:diguanylate cyclase [Rhizobium alarense]MCF3641934.1 diguanylate cyclase [Rhizobium alarense]